MSRLNDEELIDELRSRIRDYNQALTELQQVTLELTRVNDKLLSSESLKSHFISNIMNEIVNPFSSILALSKAILSVDKENWKTVLSMVAMIHTEAFALDFQFKNIFAAAKLEAGEVVPEIAQVDVGQFMQHVTASFRMEARKRKITLDATYPLPAEGKEALHFRTDPEKLKLILTNLVQNAFKVSREGDTVGLNLTLMPDALVVEVSDQGPGIPDMKQPTIFDRFNRSNTAIHSKNQGQGLGLSISKALLDLLGGDIQFTSQPTGTVFRVRIPEAHDAYLPAATDGDALYFTSDQVF